MLGATIECETVLRRRPGSEAHASTRSLVLPSCSFFSQEGSLHSWEGQEIETRWVAQGGDFKSLALGSVLARGRECQKGACELVMALSCRLSALLASSLELDLWIFVV